MVFGDRIDEFLDKHGLADTRPAKQADLAATRIGREQIDDLDSSDEYLRLRRLFGENGRVLMDGAALREFHRTGFVDWLSNDVDDAPERAVSDRDGDGRSRIGHLIAAHQTLSRIHGDRAHCGLA